MLEVQKVRNVLVGQEEGEEGKLGYLKDERVVEGVLKVLVLFVKEEEVQAQKVQKRSVVLGQAEGVQRVVLEE